MLQAAAEGKFRVVPVDRIEQALEVLTGVRAGAADADGRYPPKTLLGRAQRRLREMSRRLYPPRKDTRKAKKKATPRAEPEKG